MLRSITVSTIGLMAIMTLNAGQIEIGGSNGLTPAYINTANACTGGTFAQSGFVGCLNVASATQGSPNPTGITGSNTGTGITGVANSGNGNAWINKAFQTGTYEAAKSGGSPVNPGGTTTGVNPVNAPNGVSFSMSQATTTGCGSPATQYCATGLADFGQNTASPSVPQAGLYTLTVPVGIYDVSSVSTLLNDFWASTTAQNLAGAPAGAGNNGQSTAVTFEFGTASDGSGTNTYETVYLTNGQDIRNSVQAVTCNEANCTSVSNYAQTFSSLNNNLTEYQSGSGFAGILSGTNVGSISEVVTPDAIPVTAFSGGGLSAAYGNVQSGNLNSDEQTFSFGSAFANQFLVAVILDNQMTPNATVGSTGGSKDSLAAITVTQAPEPSTIFLLLTGLGSIGLGTLRRRK